MTRRTCRSMRTDIWHYVQRTYMYVCTIWKYICSVLFLITGQAQVPWLSFSSAVKSENSCGRKERLDGWVREPSFPRPESRAQDCNAIRWRERKVVVKEGPDSGSSQYWRESSLFPFCMPLQSAKAREWRRLEKGRDRIRIRCFSVLTFTECYNAILYINTCSELMTMTVRKDGWRQRRGLVSAHAIPYSLHSGAGNRHKLCIYICTEWEMRTYVVSIYYSLLSFSAKVKTLSPPPLLEGGANFLLPDAVAIKISSIYAILKNRPSFKFKYVCCTYIYPIAVCNVRKLINS
jgi:hypothetical protein